MATVSEVGRRVDVDLLVTAGDIASRVGVETQTVHMWAARHPGFPASLRLIGRYQVWLWPEVERWLKATDRLG